ncbi:hypothetical protein NPX13_g5258 [Xylaria arbuscula]|uniref:Uncharacterized protein n=1 Tax=Xylaria arbuscula TaxID=114810 RepID=A0A9W8NEB6_9PEZI|nr:hypothetical protein NPX13_g5258 [Xylaria arbuscula]
MANSLVDPMAEDEVNLNDTSRLAPALEAFRHFPNEMQTLRCLGFNHKASLIALRYLETPTGGASSRSMLLAASLISIGRLPQEDEIDPPKAEWKLVFAKVLRPDALEELGEYGIYLEPTFSEAKLSVLRILEK